MNKLTFSVLLYAAGSTLAHANITDPEAWVSVPQANDPAFENLTIPNDAATKGMWSDVKYWPMNGLHAALLPDGRVLTFGSSPNGNQQNGRYYDVWDPAQGFSQSAHNTVYDPNRQDSFCAAAAYLPDGTLMISGGNGSTTSTLYETESHTSTTSASSMAEARWYATMINLPDGRPIIMGGMVPYTEGMVDNPDQAIANGWPSMTPEVFENGQWRSLFGAYNRKAFGPDYLRTSYPRAWVAPDGRIFGISAEQMWYLDADSNNGNGEVISMGEFKGPYSFNNPVNVGATNTAVMYTPGKILQVGGNGSFNGDELPASNMATVIDITAVTPLLDEQPAMAYPRRYPNAIVLPNGDVVVTGGATYGNNYNGQPASAVYPAEIWNPETESWTEGASADTYRGYHSISTLLANGTILSTGGGTPGPVTNLNAEIFYPPYLFESANGQSQLAIRPAITAISGLTYDNLASLQVDLTTDEPIAQLVLIGLSSGTHSFNSGQRRIPLSFTQDQFRLSTVLPNNFIAPPGYYQVVAINDEGTPSNAVIIGIGQGQAAPPIDVEPYDPPSLEQPIATPSIAAGESATYSTTPTAGVTYSWSFSDTGETTEFSTDPTISHTFAQPGVFVVTLTAQSSEGALSNQTFVQAVSTASTPLPPVSSSQSTLDHFNRLWVVNPDNNTVTVIDTANQSVIDEIEVGTGPQSVAVAPNGDIWVSNKGSSTVSIIDGDSLNVSSTIELPLASQPHGLAFSPDEAFAFVVLEASGSLLKINPNTQSVESTQQVGMHARHIAITADSETLLVSRFITPVLNAESTATVDTQSGGGEVLVIDSSSLSIESTILLQYSNKADTEIQGSGLPNYLAAPVISPDGTSAWIPSKQDNLSRGTLRNGLNLDFQNTVRAISSRIDLVALQEDYGNRIDHDNSSLGSAAAFHPNGVYLFVALETSREVAVVNAVDASELFRIPVGIAPQSLTLSADGQKLFVKEFLERSVRVINLEALLNFGQLTTAEESLISTVSNELLSSNVLSGKALFYDAKDTRLAKDSYMSCASCHNNGGHDGRVWDLSGFGEGLRNTIALNGRAGMGHGFLHWSANFDEVQDFETQIRDLSGGSGLMADSVYFAGTRNQPLGDAKTGFSTDLDNLAAYVESLNTFSASPLRNNDGTMTASAIAGETVFMDHCASCHGSQTLTFSGGESALANIGTIDTETGLRLGQPISGIDIPTLRDTWQTAPYLHDGSAATVSQAILAHTNVNLNSAELENISAFVLQVGSAAVEFNENPTVALIQPNDNSVFFEGDNTTLQANASDIDGTVSAVAFYVNGALYATDTTAPYSVTWNNLPLGNHSVYAIAYDNKGASATSNTHTVSVQPVPANSAPSVNITAPGQNSWFFRWWGTTIQASASDSDGTVTKVEFYAGSTLLYTDTSAPYSYRWRPSRGTYTLTAKAYDNDGAVTTSSPVNTRAW